MADYIDREAARDLMYHKQDALTEYDLNSIPAADVVPVVRCRDCRYYNKAYWHDGKCYGTFCDYLRRDCGKEFFCAFGKNRGDDDG